MVLALVVGLLAATGWIAAPAAGATGDAAGTGTVYVVQGIAETTASMTLDGRIIAQDVAAKTVVGPLTVAPGAHTVQLWRGDDAIAQAWFRASAGSSTDLVAHRYPDAAKAPAFTTYANDISPTPSGQSRLLVAHTAVAPPSDIVVNGRTLIRNLANGEFSTSVVPAGSYDVSIVPTATAGPAILGPSTLEVGSGQLVNVFAIGDSSAGRMDAVVQVLPVGATGGTVPSKVETGTGGQAAGLFRENRSGDLGLPLLTALVALIGAVLAARIRRRIQP